MSALVVADKVGAWYGQVVGLSELTLEIAGGLTGLVGPNGAGKSTFLKLVAGEMKPARGTIHVDAALIHVSPPDASGLCSLGTSVDFLWEAAPARSSLLDAN